MILAGLVFLTPAAAVVAAAVLLPLAAFVVARRRVAAVRRTLTLEAPSGRVDVATLASPAAVVLLLALAAAQPAYSTAQTQRVRTDAEALFVLDISLSMAAAPSRSGPTRLERAKADASRMRAAIPEVPSGVATMTDRVVPYLLPVPDAAAFDATLAQSVAIDEPPPREINVRATNFDSLARIPAAGYFADSTKHRVVVLLTDGESDFYDQSTIAAALNASPKTQFVAVHVWRGSEQIYRASGRPEPSYRPDPASKMDLARLAEAVHGRVFGEGELAGASAALRALLGSGSTRSVGRTRTTHPLAPYVALVALLPLSLVFRRRARGSRD